MPIWELGSYDTESFLFLSLGLPTFVTPNYHIRPPATLFKKACEKVLNPWLSHLNEAIFDPTAEPLIEEHHGGHTENCPAKLCPSSGPQNPEISSNGCCFGLTRLLSGKKNLPANAGDAGAAVLIPGSGRAPGVGNGKPTPVLLPGESHGQMVAQSWTQLSTQTHARTAWHAQIPSI